MPLSGLLLLPTSHYNHYVLGFYRSLGPSPWQFCGSYSVFQLCPTLCNPTDCSPPGSSLHGIFQTKKYWSGLPFPPPGDLPRLGIKPSSPALQVDSSPTELPGKPDNYLKGLDVKFSLYLHYTYVFSWAPKSLWTVTAAMRLKDVCPLEGKL